jgi:hypothetical protein
MEVSYGGVGTESIRVFAKGAEIAASVEDNEGD